jgi:hypothetical protein
MVPSDRYVIHVARNLLRTMYGIDGAPKNDPTQVWKVAYDGMAFYCIRYTNPYLSQPTYQQQMNQ